MTEQTRVPSLKDSNIRSGIEELLEANKETSMADAHAINTLKTLLSQMNSGSGNRLVLSPRFPWTRCSTH